MNRKNFLKTSTGIVAATALPFSSFANTKQSNNMNAKKVMLKKSLVYGMIEEDLSMADKFKLVKDLGFDGVELNSPNDFDTSEALEAKEKSGIELPSVINKEHWSKPFYPPDYERFTKTATQCVCRDSRRDHSCDRGGLL